MVQNCELPSTQRLISLLHNIQRVHRSVGLARKTESENAWNKLCPDLEGEKTFNDNHNFVQLILGFQECDQEDVETWMACDSEDCGFQMLNDDKIATSVQEESDPVDYEMDEDEDNNSNESSKGPSNADAFSVLETVMEWYEQQSE
ncbi:uncharacterized protein TNCV_1982881 [Trichonephila clavipes]|nr:uncharacterized protein TNCV_1982881 [Trichonephila clavipes]